MPEISIIIPIYNAEKYIERCISSILNQSFSNFELILVIDGSTDKSLSICNEFSEQDNRIRVIAQENGGAHSARKAGFKVSSAPYITFVDADDTLPHNALEILYTEIKKGYDIVKGLDALNSKNTFSGKKKEFNSQNFVEGVCLDDITPFLWGAIYKRSLFDEFIFDICIKNNITIGEDWITNLYVGKRINNALIIELPVYNYFTNENSIMNTYTMSDEYGNRVGKISTIVIGNDPQWDYMKLLKKATCISNFFNPSRSFLPEVYHSFKEFVSIYGMNPLYRYVDKRYLWFSKYEYIYRIYSWCYRKVKTLKKGKKETIK